MNSEKKPKKNNVITIRLDDNQYKFLYQWKKQLEDETHLEIPMATLIRRLINIIDPEKIRSRSASNDDAEVRIQTIKELLLKL